MPPSLTPCCEAVPFEAYLLAGFFFASFCLFCFWVFFGDLSPIIALLSQAIPGSLTSSQLPAAGIIAQKVKRFPSIARLIERSQSGLWG